MKTGVTRYCILKTNPEPYDITHVTGRGSGNRPRHVITWLYHRERGLVIVLTWQMHILLNFSSSINAPLTFYQNLLQENYGWSWPYMASSNSSRSYDVYGRDSQIHSWILSQGRIGHCCEFKAPLSTLCLHAQWIYSALYSTYTWVHDLGMDRYTAAFYCAFHSFCITHFQPISGRISHIDTIFNKYPWIDFFSKLWGVCLV